MYVIANFLKLFETFLGKAVTTYVRLIKIAVFSADTERKRCYNMTDIIVNASTGFSIDAMPVIIAVVALVAVVVVAFVAGQISKKKKAQEKAARKAAKAKESEGGEVKGKDE